MPLTSITEGDVCQFHFQAANQPPLWTQVLGLIGGRFHHQSCLAGPYSRIGHIQLHRRITLSGNVNHRELKLRARYILLSAVLKPDDDVLTVPECDICARNSNLQWASNRCTSVLCDTKQGQEKKPCQMLHRMSA